MRKLLFGIILLPLLLIPVHGAQIDIPQAPSQVQAYMPYEDETFLQGLLYVLTSAVSKVAPDLAEGMATGLLLLTASLATSFLSGLNSSIKKVSELILVIFSATSLLGSTRSLIGLGIETITELDSYSKLLIPVMTTAMASGGGVTTSAALYAGTTLFSILLITLISKFFVPLLYVYIALSVSNRALGADVFSSFKQFIKWLMTWLLKIVLYVFTGYMTITGVVSGSVDAMTIKATKITISGMVPVVGGIISDASEAILVGAGVLKNAAGLYGIFAFLAISILPILKMTVHCIILKTTAALCGVFSQKNQCGLIDDFSQAMSMCLAATGSICLLLLISIVAFMKGVN